MDKIYESVELLEKRCNLLEVVVLYPVAIFESMTKNRKLHYTICTQNAHGVGNIFEEKRRALYGA